MADILNLIATSSQNNDERQRFIQDLLVNKSDVPFDKEEGEVIQNTLLSLINNQLNYSASRYDGLKLLLKTLTRCSKDTLNKYAVLWMTKALQVLDVAQNDCAQVTTACEVIAKLVISCKEIPELQKQISMQNVKQLITHANSLVEERKFGAIFYLIAVLLYHYPEPCERLQVTIKKMIIPLVDSKQDNLVRAGAKCFALLTFATERSFQPPAGKTNLTAWIYSQVLICNSLHETMDALFSGVAEIEHVDIWDKLTLPTIPETDVMVRYLGLEQRFNNLCVYLSTLLQGCGIKNSVCPTNIFKVLSRGFFITPAGLGNENAFRKQILHLILPKLHISLLHVFDAFVASFGKELVPYGRTVLQFLRQILTWTEKVIENTVTLDGSRPFKNTRIRAYKSLTTWLMYTGAMSGIENVCEEFLSHIMKDIVPEKDRVELFVQKTHNMSKRALKRHRDNQFDNNLAQFNAPTASNPLMNADLAKEALIALQNIILNTGCRLKSSFHETSQTVVVAVLRDCYLGTHEQTFYKQNNDCRLHLLKTLKMLQLNPHPLIPPPTQYSIELFQMAQHDVDLNITDEAKISLAEIEKIVHPAAPTLRLPISVDTHRPENDDVNNFEITANSITRLGVADNFDENIEDVHQSSLNFNDKVTKEVSTENIIEESSQMVSDRDKKIENPRDLQEFDENDEEKSSTVPLVENIIHSDIAPPNDSDKNDDNGQKVEKHIIIQPQDQSDIDDITQASAEEVDGPLVKRRCTELVENVETKSEKKLEERSDSEEEITMLNLFCNTLKEDQ